MPKIKNVSFQCSPEPGNSPGWRKLMSNAQHPKNMLLREKALLFKDYIQPYHFLSSDKKKPDTSAESIYGSTVEPYPNETESSSQIIPRHKRSYQPKVRRASPVPGNIYSDKDKLARKNTLDSSPDSFKREPHRLRRKPPHSNDDSPISERRRDNAIPSNMAEATSMEWDPYLENRQKGKNKRSKPTPRRKRNISPISEEDEGKPTTSIDAQNGSDGSASTTEGSTYTESNPTSAKTNTEDSTDIHSPVGRKGQITTDVSSSTSTSDKGGNTPSRSRSLSTEDSPCDPRYVNNR